MPDLSAAPAPNGLQYYSTNPLASAFPAASNIPGLFMISPQPGDNGHVVVAAMRAAGKTILFGAVTNHRNNGGWRYENTGSFLFFEE
jgi:hypothetical protein